MMILLVGLGNIGRAYDNTYHNVGFQCLSSFVDGEFKQDHKLESFVFTQAGIVYAKPTTMMNRSGRAVQKLQAYYQISRERTIIIHDDSDISLGEYKIHANRGTGGHNGIASIIDFCGGKEMTRVRIGVRAEQFQFLKAKDFVLQPISVTDRDLLETIYKDIARDLSSHIQQLI